MNTATAIAHHARDRQIEVIDGSRIGNARRLVEVDNALRMVVASTGMEIEVDDLRLMIDTINLHAYPLDRAPTAHQRQPQR